MKEVKGMRSFSPDEHVALQAVLNGWTKILSLRGFRQYKTPIIDSIDLHSKETSEDILKEETYRFKDRKGRDIVLRPEITPGLSSMIIKLQEEKKLRVPYKVFSIGSVFRYENTQKGRSREHIQLNVDIFGEKNIWSDAEVIEVAFETLESIGLKKKDFVVHINDRANMENKLMDLKIKKKDVRDIFRILDKRAKVTKAETEKNLKKYTNVSIGDIDKALKEVPKNVDNVMKLLQKDIKSKYDCCIVRGFDYYTGIVFEIFAVDKKSATRSVVGGGRYDNLIESFGGQSLPAAGFGMGDVIILDCMKNVKIKRDPLTIFCYTSESMEQKAYSAFKEIKIDQPVSFIGFVKDKKLSTIYKNYEPEGVKKVISMEEDGFSVRDLEKRKTETAKNIKEVITIIKEK